MNFSKSKRRKNKESIIPMINVVFLLLIFFLMTAEITPPVPFEVTLPIADQNQEPTGEHSIYLSKEAVLGFEGVTGSDALEALRLQADKATTLKLYADSDILGSEVAITLKTLTALGFSKVEVIVNG